MEFIKKYKFIIIGVLLSVSLLIGGTYAWVNIEISGTKTNKIIAGTLSMELDESTCTAIDIDNAIPITDDDGMKQVACTFTLENTGNLVSGYSLYLDDVDLLSGETRMDNSDIKYSLVKNSVNTIGLFSDFVAHPDRMIDSGVLSVGGSNTYELRLWIDKDASNSAMGKVVSVKLRVKSEVGEIDPSTINYNLSDFYVYAESTEQYATDLGLNRVALKPEFKTSLENNTSYTDSLGNVWNSGDPLPNPGIEFELNGVMEPVESTNRMFFLMTIETLDLSLWDTSNVVNMERMFAQTSIEHIDLSSFDTSNVIDMSNMFFGIKIKELNLVSFEVSDTTDINGMFTCDRGIENILGSTQEITDLFMSMRGGC